MTSMTMAHNLAFSDQSESIDSQKTLRIRKLLSGAAQCRSEALRRLESEKSNQDLVPHVICRQSESENQIALKFCKTDNVGDGGGTKDATWSHCTSARPEDQPGSRRPQHSLPSDRSVEYSASQHSIPHKLAALIADVHPTKDTHGSSGADTHFAEGHSFGADGVEELRREIERLIEATGRATARDVEVAELRAEIRSRYYCRLASPPPASPP